MTSSTTTTATNCDCEWTSWMNGDYRASRGDNNSYERLRQNGHVFCDVPTQIQCRDHDNPELDFHLARQPHVVCDVTSGLECIVVIRHKDSQVCSDYEIRVECCTCPEPSTIPPSTVPSSTLMTNTTTTSEDDVISDHITRPMTTITIDENWIPALIIFIVLLFLFSFIIFYVCRRRRNNKEICCWRQKPTEKSRIFNQNKIFNFAKFTLSRTESLPPPPSASSTASPWRPQVSRAHTDRVIIVIIAAVTSSISTTWIRREVSAPATISSTTEVTRSTPRPSTGGTMTSSPRLRHSRAPIHRVSEEVIVPDC